jgi:type II secretory pathway pseudopilin PulG
MLLAVVFLLALLTLSLSVAVPRMSKAIQRDREVETMHRGKQYIRGIQLYYRKFHAYPPSVDALVKTNEIRFLRKRYIDPMTGKDDWKPILFGQNKAPTAMGFFGQPLSTGGSIAGIGPSGGNGLNGVNGASGMNGLNGASSGGGLFNSSLGGASPFDSSNSGSNPTTPSGSTDNGSGTTGSGTDSSGGSASGNGLNGSATSGTTGTGTGTGTGLGGQTGGQTFGGAGIIGFSPASPKPSILVYKKKEHYNEWEFVYDPIMELKTIPGGGATGLGGANGGSGVPGFGGSSGGAGSGFGGAGNGFGGAGGGFGSTPPQTPTAPAPPQ